MNDVVDFWAVDNLKMTDKWASNKGRERERETERETESERERERERENMHK